MICFPPVTRVAFHAIMDEDRVAWKVMAGEGVVWLPRSVATVINYASSIFDVESWFARQCLREDYSIARRNPVAHAPIEELRFHPAHIITSQADSREHQREAFDKLRDSRVFALLMKCRTGKTKVGVDLACRHLSAGRIRQVLWMCPVSVIPTARWQWGRFSQTSRLAEPETLRFFGIETLSACKQERYEALIAWVRRAPTLCVIDESHMVKTSTAKRSKRTERLAALSVARGIMSGSPITRDIRDIFWQYFVLDWRILGYRNRHQFDRQHVEYNSKYPGIVARTMREEYITDRAQPFTFEFFPPDNDQDTHDSIYVPMSDDQRCWYERVKDAIIDRIEQYDSRPHDVYLLFTALQSVLSGEISKTVLRHIGIKDAEPVRLVPPKLEAIADRRSEIDAKAIIWCTRRHEVQSLVSAFPETYVVTGSISPTGRHEIIQKFRKSACGTLVAMVQVAKRGIDIFEADTAFFYGQSFDFESREQAAYRIQAPGIKDTPCQYIDMIYSDSLDERIIASHGRKENIIKSFVRLLRQSKDKAIEEMRKL